MTDRYTAAQRSRVMSKVHGRDTKPEMVVRRLTHSMGYRYRLHRKDLPGKPDLVFPSRRKAILVHGCFWHGHDCKSGQTRPQSNREFWDKKLDQNKLRDAKNQADLLAMGWSVCVIWGCQTKDVERLRKCIREFLEETVVTP